MTIFAVLWSGKYLITLFSAVFFAIAFYYATFVAEERYSATINLVFAAESNSIVDIESVVSATSADRVSINTELRVIRSRAVIRSVVEQLNLVEDPEFNVSLQEPATFSRANLRRAVLSWIGQDTATGPLAPEVAMEGTISRVRSAISVSAQRETYIMTIRVVTGDRKKSNQIADVLARQYLSHQIDTKYKATEYAVSWLSERVAELEDDLNTREAAIADLLSKRLVSDEAQAALQVRANELRQRIQVLEAQDMTARAALEALTQQIEARDFAALADSLDSPVLRQLMDAGVASTGRGASSFMTEVQRIRAAQTEALQRSSSQLEALRGSYQDLQVRIDGQSEALSQLNQLTREATNTRVLYETFLARLKETSVQMSLQQADSRILSPATRGSQIAPRRMRIMTMALVLGGLVGAGLVLFRQFVYSGFRNADDLENYTQSQVLGQIPLFPSWRRGDILPHLAAKPTGAAAEAIRDLRTSILMSDLDRTPQIILSTSSVPGEGKTTLAVSLAHNLAGLGKRVLLMECDLRRCTLLDYFPNNATHTLMDVLTSDMPLEQAAVRQNEYGFDVLFGKKTSVNPADLVSSQRFGKLLADARKIYDYIVIDTPPVLVVPDARVISRHADALIYSVRWNATHRGQVREGLRQLASAGRPANGLILSQINSRKMKHYGYGGRYGTYGPYSSYSSAYYDS